MGNKIISKNLIIGKIILVSIMGIGIGYFYHLDNVDRYKRGQELSMESYVKNFLAHKAELMKDTNNPIGMDLLIVIILIFGVFGVYEILSYLIGSIVNKASGVNANKERRDSTL